MTGPETGPVLGEDEWPRSARTCTHGSLWSAPCADCAYGVAGPELSGALEAYVAALVTEAERRGAQAERERLEPLLAQERAWSRELRRLLNLERRTGEPL